MAIPFLIGVGAVAVVGGGIVLSAAEKMDLANDINNDAQRIAKNAENRFNATRKSSNNTLQEPGKKKISVMAGSVKKFADNYSRIKNLSFNDSVGLDELRNFNPDDPEFLDIEKEKS